MRPTLLLAAACFPAAAFASPIDSKPPANIVNNTNSEVRAGESSDQGVYWVLPPSKGTSRTSSTLPFLDRDQCNSLRSVDTQLIRNKEYQDRLIEQRIAREDALNPNDPAYDEKLRTIQSQFDARNRAAMADREQQITARARMLEGFNVAPPDGAAILTFRFAQPWTANIARLRRENPGKQFVRVPLLEASNLWTLPTAEGSRFIHFGLSGGTTFDPLHRSIIAASAGSADEFQASAVGNYQIACAGWYQPIGNAIPLTLQTVYRYQVKTAVHFRAKYNLYQMYNSLLTAGKSSGLFTSRSWQSYIESNEIRQAISFDWDVTDVGNNVPADKRREVEEDVRQYLIASLPALLAQSGVIKQSDIGPPDKPGAPAVGEALRNGCGANAYCQAGALAFTVLGAAFSSSSQSSEVRKRLDIVSTYESRATEMRIRYGVIDYVNGKWQRKGRRPK